MREVSKRRGSRRRAGRPAWWRAAGRAPNRRRPLPVRPTRAGSRGLPDPLSVNRSRGDAERGSATVEIAVALPALVLVTAAAIWGVTLAAAQVGCVDAVRAGARAAARGEPLPAVRAVVAGAVPAGARVGVRRGGETTRVDVAVTVRPPMLSGLPALTLRAHALAATEPGVSRS